MTNILLKFRWFLLKFRWFLKRWSYPILFRGTPEQLRDMLLKRKWYEHRWYILEDTRIK